MTMRANTVKELSERDHVLKRSGVYLGDTTPGKHERWVFETPEKISKQQIDMVPGLIKLFDEIISNSIDEALRTDFAFANMIQVHVNSSGKISVEDNGRGIPIESSAGETKTGAEKAFTHMRAGGNFDDEDFVSIGTNGMGSTLVNIWSKDFVAVTDDGSKRMNLHSDNNMFETEVKISNSKKNGTKVSFTPDYERLGLEQGLDNIHRDLIKKRVADLAVCYPQIKFFHDGKLVRTKNFKTYLDLINEENVFLETDKWKVAVLPSESEEQISFVNGIDTFRGGTHVDTAKHTFVMALRDRIKKVHKIDIKPSEIKNHLLFVLIIDSINTPKFDSQTKERISTNAKEYGNLFDDIIDSRFINKVVKNDEIVFPMIETIKLKMEVAERQELNRQKKKVSKMRVAKHIPAQGKNIEENILFLAEGDSALNRFVDARENEIHGGYPLRGKPLNINGLSLTKIIKNKELSEIMGIVGLELGKPAVELNYGTIGIMADADVDGISISGLLINFLAQWPSLFEQGRVKILKSPIVIAQKGKNIKRFYNLRDYDASKHDGWNVTYNKGLGTLSKEEYEYMLKQPKFDTVVLDVEAKNSLEMLYGSNADLRKEWLMR